MVENGLGELLGKIGITTQSIHRMRLGHGVVGKLTTIAIVVVITIGFITAKINNLFLTAGVVIFIAVFAIYAFRKILNNVQ